MKRLIAIEQCTNCERGPVSFWQSELGPDVWDVLTQVECTCGVTRKVGLISPTKICRLCKKVKPLDEFNDDPTLPDGKTPLCTKCEGRKPPRSDTKSGGKNPGRVLEGQSELEK